MAEAKFTPEEWEEEKNPFVNEPIDLEMHGPDVRIKRFMIYEDEKIKVTRVENPTYMNEQENYVELVIKDSATIVYFPIGGYITRAMAIDAAKRYVSVMEANEDMYEALEKLVSYCEHLPQAKFMHELKEARAALSKAEGK